VVVDAAPAGALGLVRADDRVWTESARRTTDAADAPPTNTMLAPTFPVVDDTDVVLVRVRAKADAQAHAHRTGMLMVATDIGGPAERTTVGGRAVGGFRHSKQFFCATVPAIAAAVLAPAAARATPPLRTLWYQRREGGRLVRDEYVGACMYEALSWRPTRLYIDLDLKFADCVDAPAALATQDGRAALTARLVALLVALLHREYAVAAVPADFLVLDASRAGKMSRHIHVPDALVFRTRLDLALFMGLFFYAARDVPELQYTHRDGKRMFIPDPSVYAAAAADTQQNFRVAYAHKAPDRPGGPTYPLVPAPDSGWRPAADTPAAWQRAALIQAPLPPGIAVLGAPRSAVPFYRPYGRTWSLVFPMHNILVAPAAAPAAAARPAPPPQPPRPGVPMRAVAAPEVSAAFAAAYGDVWPGATAGVQLMVDGSGALLTMRRAAPEDPLACAVCDREHHGAGMSLRVARTAGGWGAWQSCFVTRRAVRLAPPPDALVAAIERAIAR
jgi:hypothetical protein